jgi:nucleoid-associated protein YgaU
VGISGTIDAAKFWNGVPRPSRRPNKGKLMSIFRRKKEPEKRADFSNIRSGSTSTGVPAAPMPEPPDITGPAGEGPTQEGHSQGGQTHVVAKGESLSKIAKQHYGDANQWRRIYEANRDQISNPDLIHPGQTLKIPSA